MQKFMIFFLLMMTLGICSCSDDGDDKTDTSCGVILNEKFYNPINPDDGEKGNLSAVTGRGLVTIRLDDKNEALLVALHGLEYDKLDEEVEAEALDLLQQILDSGNTRGYFYRAEEDCTVRIKSTGTNKTEAVPGQFILDNGLNLSELLLSEAAARVGSGNVCNSNELKPCYNGLLLEGLS